MDVRLNLDELDVLREVAEKARQQLLHELHHVDSREYRKTLRARTDLLESALQKLEAGWRGEPLGG